MVLKLIGAPPPANKALTNLNNKILPYSAIKIIANPPAPYSTLNPDTSSLSPSAKSKGVRLVSANPANSQNPINKNLIESKDTRNKEPNE